MEPYKIKVDVPENPKIKSETPGEQKLREGFFVQNPEENSLTEDSFSPVFKMTKQETSFTKGDHKVQKVFIKQDVADGSSRYLIEIPSNPNIRSATIREPHLIRFVENDQSYEDNKAEKENKVVLPSPRSKIPRLGDKLKHIVDQMKFDGIATKEAKIKSSAKPSSIPQPQPRAFPRIKRIQRTKVNDNHDISYDNHDKNNVNHNISYDNHDKNTDNHVTNTLYEAKTNPEEEFDKLFEEIVDKEPSPVLIEKLLNVRPDSITDVKFEQIIHDYDTNKLKPIFIDEQCLLNKSRIPLLKRKSDGNIKVSSFLELYEKRSQNNDKQAAKKPERNDNKARKYNVVNETSQNNEEVILRRKKTEFNDDEAYKAECRKAGKESKIPLLKQISNDSIKYPGTHRRASLKKSISHIDYNRSDVKENVVSTELNKKPKDDGQEEKDNQKPVDDAVAVPTIAREEQVKLQIATNLVKNAEVETVTDKTKLIENDKDTNKTNKESQEDKGEAKFFIHALRMKYEKLSRENSQEQLFDEIIKPSHDIEEVKYIQKSENVKIYDDSDFIKNNIVSNVVIETNNTAIEVCNENKPGKRDTEVNSEKPSENDGRKTPIKELRKKFEYLSRENSQESIKRAGIALMAFDIEPTNEKIETSNKINTQTSTEPRDAETNNKSSDNDGGKTPINNLRMKFEYLSRENSQENIKRVGNALVAFEIEPTNEKNEIANKINTQTSTELKDTEVTTTLSKNDGIKTPINELRMKFEYLSRENSQESIKRPVNALVVFEIEPTNENIEKANKINTQTSTEGPIIRKELEKLHQNEAKNDNFKHTLKLKHINYNKRPPITDLLQKFESLSRENSFIDLQEGKRDVEYSSTMNRDEDDKSIQEIDVLELYDAVEVEIETLVADLGDDYDDDDDFGEIKLKHDDIGVTNELLAPKKTVLAKVDLFERQSSKDAPPISPSYHHDKPKIVEEVLKTPVMSRKEYKIVENVIKPHFHRIIEIPIQKTATTINIDERNIEKVHITNYNVKNNKTLQSHNDIIVKNISNYTRQDSKTIKTYESIPTNFMDNKLKNIDIQEKKSTKDNFTGHNLVNDRKSRFENSHNEVKCKETESNKISKDKVSNLVNKIGSMENLLVDEKIIIPPKERPRRNSVSEKIALFEKKLTVFNMDDPVKKINITTDASATTNEKLTQRSHTMPKDKENDGKTANTNDSALNEKLQELKNASQKYGTFDHMSYFKLNSGDKMPVIALGTALLDPILIGPLIEAAIDLGYRAFDCAFIYGNETDVGEALRNKIQDGTVKREDLFISSKLWSTFHRPDLVAQACQTTLDNLGLDYLDLFMMHNPMSLKEGPDPLPMIANVLQYSEYDYMDAWYAMERLVDTGKVKNIGVSNFNSEQLKRILDKGRVKPVVNQVESHPYLTQERLKAFCDTHRIQLQCYGVLGSIGTPKEYKSPDFKVALEDALVKVMAAGLNVTPAQLLIGYQIGAGRAVVVKTSSAERLWTNLQALDLQLTEDQMKALNAMNTNTRNFLFTGMGDTHKNYPFNIPY